MNHNDESIVLKIIPNMNIFLIDDFYEIIKEFNEKLKLIGYFSFIVENSCVDIKITNGIEEYSLSTSIETLSNTNKILKTIDGTKDVFGINIFTFSMNAVNFNLCSRIMKILGSILNRNHLLIKRVYDEM